MYIHLPVKYPFFLSDFNGTDRLPVLKYQILCKSVHWKPSCSTQSVFNAVRLLDIQTDMTKLIVAFLDFANALKDGTAVI